MDVARSARFVRHGHRVAGGRSQRSRSWMRPETRVGYDYIDAIVDDHSRLAFVERHDDETAATVTGFVERALADFAARGITVRLMTTTPSPTSRTARSRELLTSGGIRHLTTAPYRPQCRRALRSNDRHAHALDPRLAEQGAARRRFPARRP